MVITNMKSFLQEIYADGVNPMCLCGVHAMQVGNLVLNADDVKKIFPKVDFVKMNEKTKNILVEIQKEFFKAYKGETLDFALYDWHPLGNGDIRAVFPHDILSGTVEPSCGTGSIAIGIAIVATGEVEREGIYEVSLETVDGAELGGSERATLLIQSNKSVITNISFSYSLVKNTSVGEIMI